MGNHVDTRFWSLLDRNFWFCPTKDCDIVYFNNRRGIYFVKDEVNVPVFHKEDDPSRPVCYCFNVTEQMIRDEIFKKGCCDSLEDIAEYTKAGTGRWCPITNPSGKCCKEYLEPLVEDLLKMLPKEGMEQGMHVINILEAKPSKSPLKEVRLKVYGMTCQGCVSAVKSVLEQLEGKRINVSLSDGLVKAIFPLSTDTDLIIEGIIDSGYDAELLEERRIR